MTRPAERPPDPALDGPGVRPVVRRFLARPYASLQLLLTAGIGLLCFGFLMAVSTTIARRPRQRRHRLDLDQVVKEVEFVAPRAADLLVRAAPVTAPLPAAGLPDARRRRRLAGRGARPGHRRRRSTGRAAGSTSARCSCSPRSSRSSACCCGAADLLARKQHLGTLTRARHLFVPLLPGFVLVVALVMLEPDLGTTLCFMLVLLGLLWMIGMPARYFGAVVALVGVAVTVLAVTEPYRLQRLTAFVHPFKDMRTSGYHTVEGLYALASGGVSAWASDRAPRSTAGCPTPTPTTSSPSSARSSGWSAASPSCCCSGCSPSPACASRGAVSDPFVRIACGGATIWLVGQAVINIGYVSGLLPVTGIPLPLISAGGTSLLVTFFVLGMLASFARHERDAVNAARRADRLGRRSRAERWLAVPVPRVYVPPRRRRTGAAAAARGGRPDARSSSGASAGRVNPASRPPASSGRATAGRAGPGAAGRVPCGGWDERPHRRRRRALRRAHRARA